MAIPSSELSTTVQAFLAEDDDTGVAMTATQRRRLRESIDGSPLFTTAQEDLYTDPASVAYKLGECLVVATNNSMLWPGESGIPMPRMLKRTGTVGGKGVYQGWGGSGVTKVVIAWDTDKWVASCYNYTASLDAEPAAHEFLGGTAITDEFSNGSYGSFTVVVSNAIAGTPMNYRGGFDALTQNSNRFFKTTQHPSGADMGRVSKLACTNSTAYGPSYINGPYGVAIATELVFTGTYYDFFIHNFDQLTEITLNQYGGGEWDLSGGNNLRFVDANSGSVTSINVSHCPNLAILDLSYTSCSCMAEGCPSLSYVNLQASSVAMNLNGCVRLREVNGYYGTFTQLDITNCHELRTLDLYFNQNVQAYVFGLPTLEFRHSQAVLFRLEGCDMSYYTLRHWAYALPDVSGQSGGRTLNVTNNPGVSDPGWSTLKTMLQGKGWTVTDGY